jgi:hypothetical protein
MLSAIAVLLTAIWLIGIMTSHTMLGSIHILLGFVVVIILLKYVYKYKPPEK